MILFDISMRHDIPSGVPNDVLDYLTQFYLDSDKHCKTIPVAIPIRYHKEEFFSKMNITKEQANSLTKYSTACGADPNHPFTKKVLDFLRKHSDFNYVIAEVYMLEPLSILNLAVKYNSKYHYRTYYRLTNEFSDMIYENGGSLRADESHTKNKYERWWDTYESE